MHVELVDAAAGTWKATGNDAQFSLDVGRDLPLAPGHYFFEVTILDDDPSGLLRPRIYFDHGDGMSEECSAPILLVKQSVGRYRACLIIPREVFRIRFDPTAEQTRFSLATMSLRVVSRATWYAAVVRGTLKNGTSDGFTYGEYARAAWAVYRTGGVRAVADKIRGASVSGTSNPRRLLASERLASGKAQRNSADGSGVYAAAYRSMSAGAEGYRHPDFAADKQIVTDAELCPVKTIAYYLPQFHPFPENEKWWGKGFTEWTNVTKAVPRFVGHYQPKLPADLGYYDLRVVDTMRRQAEMAKKYGLTGFCFHFYWFGGTRLMETPLLNLLEAKDIDIDYCLCWANENWTRRWDGAEHDLLIGQNHSAEDDVAFIEYVEKYFADKRYIKIDGKPVLVVYRAAILPDAAATMKRWRRIAERHGYPGLYLVATTSFGFSDYEALGFDALVEFPPHSTRGEDITRHTQFIDDRYAGSVFDYASVVDVQTKRTDYATGRVFPAVMPGWDNTARRPLSSSVFQGATPALYRKWLDFAFDRAKQNPAGEQFVFINAWNEWAEGAYLEPDRLYGHAYLTATASVIDAHSRKPERLEQIVAKHNAGFKPAGARALVAHIFYPELARQIAESAAGLGTIDVYITLPEFTDEATLETIRDLFPRSYLKLVPNIGRDVLPFFSVMRDVPLDRYEWICKIHSKKSPHLAVGDEWRSHMFDGLLGTDTLNDATNVSLMADPDIGVIGGSGTVSALSDIVVRINNEALLEAFAERFNVELDWSQELFIAGTMFWFRPRALKPLFDAEMTEEDFGIEFGRIDGTPAHAMERFIGIIARHQGYKVTEMKGKALGLKTHNTLADAVI
jgi:lipopolysaccharide biosynthesis protein